MPPLKSSEFTKLARERLGPMLGDRGFARMPASSPASWYRPEGELWLVLWFQANPWNDANAAGYQFTLELLLGRERKLYGSGFRRRFPQLLSEADRERLRHLDNQVLARLPPPDVAFIEALPGPLREGVLARWRPRMTPYGAGEHVWMRQGGREDVEELLGFIAEALPDAIAQFLSLARAEGSA